MIITFCSPMELDKIMITGGSLPRELLSSWSQAIRELDSIIGIIVRVDHGGDHDLPGVPLLALHGIVLINLTTATPTEDFNDNKTNYIDSKVRSWRRSNMYNV